MTCIASFLITFFEKKSVVKAGLVQFGASQLLNLLLGSVNV